MVKNKFRKFMKKTIPWTVTLFIIVLAVVFFDIVKTYKYWLLGILGVIILVYIFMGLFKPKKFRRGLGRRLK